MYRGPSLEEKLLRGVRASEVFRVKDLRESWLSLLVFCPGHKKHAKAKSRVVEDCSVSEPPFPNVVFTAEKARSVLGGDVLGLVPRTGGDGLGIRPLGVGPSTDWPVEGIQPSRWIRSACSILGDHTRRCSSGVDRNVFRIWAGVSSLGISNS